MNNIKISKNDVKGTSAPHKTEEVYAFGPFHVDAPHRSICRNNESLHLTPRSFDLLLLLIRNRDRVLEREEITRSVWGQISVDERNLNVSISNLRKVLGDTGGEHRYIATIPMRGYKFVALVLCPGGEWPETNPVSESLRIEGRFASIHLFPRKIIGGLLVFLLMMIAALWLFFPQKHSDRIVILVAEFEPNDRFDQYRLTRTLCDRLAQITKRYPQAEVKLLRKPISWRAGSEQARREGFRQKADIVIWGDVDPDKERAIITAHIEVLERQRELILREGTETAQVPIVELRELRYQDEFSRKMASLIVFLLGVIRFEAKDYVGAIDTFNDTLDRPDAPSAMLDPVVIHYYRGLAFNEAALHRLAHDESIGNLDLAISDFTQVISNRPHHSASFFGRGLAHASRGEFYELQRQPARAAQDFTNAIADFNESLSPKPIDHDFLKRRPATANVLWNRGLSQTHLAKLAGTSVSESSLDHLSAAISDFSQVLEANVEPFRSVKAADVHFNRGLAEGSVSVLLRQCGRWLEAENQDDRAIQDFTRVLALVRAHRGAFFNRGLAYSRKREKERAKSDLQIFQGLPGDEATKQMAAEELKRLSPDTMIGATAVGPINKSH